jgi:hypothetical protein
MSCYHPGAVKLRELKGEIERLQGINQQCQNELSNVQAEADIAHKRISNAIDRCQELINRSVTRQDKIIWIQDALDGEEIE